MSVICCIIRCILIIFAAVRFGRVPKREKAKILEQMQRVNDVQCRSTAIDAVLGSSSQLINNIVHAHMATCEFTKAKVKQFKQAAWFRGEFVLCPAQMVRSVHQPLLTNSTEELQSLGISQLNRLWVKKSLEFKNLIFQENVNLSASEL